MRAVLRPPEGSINIHPHSKLFCMVCLRRSGRMVNLVRCLHCSQTYNLCINHLATDAYALRWLCPWCRN